MFLTIIKENIYLILVSLIITYVAKFYFNYFTRQLKLPGPIPFPILGNIPQIGTDLSKALDKFYEEYGEVFEYFIGNQRIISISRPDLCEKIWGPSSMKSAFILRIPEISGADEIGLGINGVINNRNFESWRTNRKFLIQSISLPSFLRESVKLSNKLIDELFDYWKIMKEEGQNEIEFNSWITCLTTDIVGTTTLGKSMTSLTEHFNNLNINGRKYNVKSNYIKFVKSVTNYVECLMFVIIFIPFLRHYVPIFKIKNKKCMDNKEWFENEISKMVEERRLEIENTPLDQELSPNVLTLLITTNTERDLQKIKTGQISSALTNKDISSIIKEIFLEGFETTPSMISFLMYYIIKHPQVFEKIKEEVDSVYGNSKNPQITYESFSKLSYIDAVINEVLRLSSPIPLSSRTTVKDVEINGIKMKADTVVYTNFKAMHSCEKYWKDPKTFNPDRWINDKDLMVKFSYIPFGSGIRHCPGKLWAMAQIKTFLIKFVCNFNAEFIDENNPISSHYATVLRCTSLRLKIKNRNND